MCAIAGLYRLRGTCSSEDYRLLEALTQTQAHRGPDAEGIFKSSRAALGHRRLSILDLSDAGRQPMTVADGLLQLVYNGEIYNFRELRQELIAEGFFFKSGTDSEVLLHGYRRWGLDRLLNRLQGMFAFALLDLTTDEPVLHLARDRFGMKPLYYGQSGDAFLFASEAQALAASGRFSTQPSLEAIGHFLVWGSMPSPWTTIEGVQSLPAGHCLTIRKSQIQLKPYAPSLPEPDAAISRKEAVERTRALLEDAIDHHLISDVPLGVFLSGGIDSSALVALAARRSSSPLRTVSIRFNETAYDESRLAERVSQRYRTQHQETCIQASDFFDALPALLSAMDQPTIDGVNTYFVSKAARDAGLTVVLSGLGADELFLGYRHLRNAGSWRDLGKGLSHLPASLRHVLLAGAARVGDALKRPGMAKLNGLESPSDGSLYRLFRGLFSPQEVQSLLGISAESRKPGNNSGLNGLSDGDAFVQNMVRQEFDHYLQDQLLRDTDMMSMRHSVEVRVPFLDGPLVDYVLRVPSSIKNNGDRPKTILLDAVGDAVAREIWDRPKQGFAFPMREWLMSQNGMLEAMALEASPLQSGPVRQLWRRFREGRAHWSKVWATVVIAHWHARRPASIEQIPSLKG
jgi:asparagine synthase (glutamine-hydrolysing)